MKHLLELRYFTFSQKYTATQMPKTENNIELDLSAERGRGATTSQNPSSQDRHGNLGKDLIRRRQEITLLSEIWFLAAKCLITAW